MSNEISKMWEETKNKLCNDINVLMLEGNSRNYDVFEMMIHMLESHKTTLKKISKQNG